MSDDTTTLTDNSRDEASTTADHAGTEQPRQQAPYRPFGDIFGDIGTGNVKAALRLQTEMLDVLHDIGRDWMARATSEAEFAFQLPNKLTSAQTVPDALTAYHEWLNEWMSMCNEDSRRLVADSQRIMDKSVRCFASVSPSAAT